MNTQRSFLACVLMLLVASVAGCVPARPNDQIGVIQAAAVRMQTSHT